MKPMLACLWPDKPEKLRWPMLASPKLDGIRCIIKGGKVLSRSLKPIPNKHIVSWLEALGGVLEGHDGELMVVDTATKFLPFNEIQSAVNSVDGEPEFRFVVFDNFSVPTAPYVTRHTAMDHGPIVRLESVLVNNLEQAVAYCQACVQAGFEGAMLRNPEAPYKFGRSAMRDQALVKMKPTTDEDALVIGVQELMRNRNKAEKDELGRTKRSSAKAGKVPGGVAGALVCKFEDGAEFTVNVRGDAERKRLWEESPVGRWCKIKHQPPPGGRQPGQAPRSPVFLAWREEWDR